MAQALESFGLNEGEKFAFLLLSNVYVDFPDGLPARLSDGTWVFDKYPTSADTYWEKLLGTLRLQEIQEANLVLARSRTADPHQLTIDDYKLGQSLADVHAFLQLGGVVEHKAASLVVGSMTSGAAFVRQVSGIEKYRTTRGYSREPVTSTRLEQAVCLASVYGNLFARPGSSVRFRRGLNILLDGLRQENGQERLHQFVRALEALVLPEVGNTKRHGTSSIAVRRLQLPALIATTPWAKPLILGATPNTSMNGTGVCALLLQKTPRTSLFGEQGKWNDLPASPIHVF